jgi:hypothetical protein
MVKSSQSGSTVLRPTTRYTALAGLVLALAFSPSLLWDGDAFARPAKTSRDCASKYFACLGRCQANAEKKTGTTVKAQGNNPDAAVHKEVANCEARTCKPQNDNCIAAVQGGKDARPLTPQKATSKPAAGPLQPLTPQKVTKSPATAPARPLTSSSTLRQRGR